MPNRAPKQVIIKPFNKQTTYTTKGPGKPKPFELLRKMKNYLSCCGRASLTKIFRPLNSCSFNFAIASSAAASSVNVTNPKPFDRPENLSVMITASSTSPNSEKSSCNSSLVDSHARFPTNSFFAMFLGKRNKMMT